MSLQTQFIKFNDKIRIDYDVKTELKDKRDILIGILRDSGKLPGFTILNQGSYIMYTGLEAVDVPVIYAWNEPLDIGCHVAYIKLSNRGCYECFFRRDIETNELYDVTAYSEKGQLITKNLSGCGGSFIPYGSTISLKTAVICTDLLKKVISDRCNENILISSKGEGYYYEKAGLIISDAYNNQKESVLTVSGSNFAKRN